MDDKQQSNVLIDSLGALEDHIQNLFANSRVPLTGEDFVYNSDVVSSLFNFLEDHCNIQSIYEAKAPFIISGNSGSGKTALLANWMNKRQKQLARTRSGGSSDEFIFWHAVGSTRNSSNVNKLIKRLLADLKFKFELSRDLPESDDRLTWELPRFLELASKKGKPVIIIIDGINRLLNNDGSDAGLAWLPLVFPPYVRVVLSCVSISRMSSRKLKSPSNENTDTHESDAAATTMITYRSEDHTGNSNIHSHEIDDEFNVNTLNSNNMNANEAKYHRFQLEIERRQWQLYPMPLLNKVSIRHIIHSFIHKTVQADATALTTGSFLTALNYDVIPTLSEAPGFLLFESQINLLVHHSLSRSPIFLRLVLINAHYAVKHGYSLWKVWDDWLQADSVSNLYQRICTTFEEGFVSTPAQVEKDTARTLTAGGLPELQMMYPFHPAFQAMKPVSSNQMSANTLTAIDFKHQIEEEEAAAALALAHSQAKQNTAGAGATPTASAAASQEQLLHLTAAGMKNTLSNVVLQNLGDQKWLQVSEEAELKIEESRMVGEKSLEDTMEMVTKIAQDQGVSFLQAMQNHMNAMIVNNYAVLEEENRELEEDEQAYTADTIHLDTVTPHSVVHKSRPVSNRNSPKLTSILSGESLSDNEMSPPALGAMSIRSRSFMAKRMQKSSSNSSILRNTLMGQLARSMSIDDGSSSEGDGETEIELDDPADGGSTAKAVSANSSLTGPMMNNVLSIAEEEPDDEQEETDETVRAESNVYTSNNSTYNLSSAEIAVPPLDMTIRRRRSSVQAVLHAQSSKVFPSQSSTRVSHEEGSDSDDDDDELQLLAFARNQSYHNTHHRAFVHKHRRKGRDQSPQISNDPAHGLDVLPAYLKGGKSFTGFSTLLGKCLSLLYAARLGLKEDELWSILPRLGDSQVVDSDGTAYSKAKATECRGPGVAHDYLHRMYVDRGKWEDLCKSYDRIMPVRGYITAQQCVQCLQTLFPELSSTILAQQLLSLCRHFPELSLTIKTVATNDFNHQDQVTSWGEAHRTLLLPFMQNEANDTKNVASDDIILSTTGIYYGQLARALSKMEKKKLSLISSNGVEVVNEPRRLDELAFKGGIIGPVLEESLLEILRCLGLLYSPECQVLVLPVDSLILREFIRTNYIRNRRIGDITNRNERRWHMQLVRYFHSEVPKSLRRCEELPWHQRLCHRWHSLRETIADLDTFELMVQAAEESSLKNELMDYWLQLTEGPLTIYDDNFTAFSSVHTGAVDDGANQLPKHRATSATRRSSDNNSVTAGDAKEDEGVDPVGILPCFDIVEELNKSLESWVSMRRPDETQLHRTILQISSFLYEFTALEDSPPAFIRLGVDLASLYSFGISFDEIKEKIFNISQSNSPVAPVASSNANTFYTSTAVQLSYSEAGSGGINLSAPADATVPTESSIPVKSVRQQPITFFPLPYMLKYGSKLYNYLRWIWIQFPWLALHRSVDAAVEDLSHLSHQQQQLPSNSGKTYQYTSATSIDRHIKSIQDKNRIWDARKRDPNLEEINYTRSRANALIKSGITASHEHKLASIDVMFNRLYEESLAAAVSHKLSPTASASDLDPTTAAVKMRKNIVVSKDELPIPTLSSTLPLHHHLHRHLKLDVKRSKYRRNIHEELEYAKTIPFASPSLKSQKSGTLFPTVDRSIQEANRRLEQDTELYRTAHTILRLGGSASGVLLPHEESLDEIIRQQEDAEAVEAYNTYKATTAAPVSKPDEISFDREFLRVQKLKGLFDRLRSLKLSKSKQVTELINSIKIREEQDRVGMVSVETGEAAIREMTESLAHVISGLENARQLQRGYHLLLELVSATSPPYTESHLQQVEQELELAKQQCEDLMKHKINVIANTNKDIANKKRQLMDKSIYYQAATAGINLKKSNFIITSQRKGLPVTAEATAVTTLSDSARRSRKRNGSPKQLSPGTRRDKNKKLPSPQGNQETGTLAAASYLNTASVLSHISMISGTSGDSTAHDVDENSNSTGSLNELAVPTARKVVQIALGSNTEEPATAPSLHQCNGELVSARVAVESILEKSGCQNIEAFVDRFKTGVKLAESLRSHQILADSKLAQLRSEHSKLSGSLEDGFNVSTRISGDQNRPVSTGERDARYFDNKLLDAELQLHQSRKQMERSLELINEARIGISHIISLIQANAKVMAALPKNPLPAAANDLNNSNIQRPGSKRSRKSHSGGMESSRRGGNGGVSRESLESGSSSGIVIGLSWCEERILAMNELLMLETTKPAAGSTQQSANGDKDEQVNKGDMPLHLRQSLLASEVMGSSPNKHSHHHYTSHNRNKANNENSLSKQILERHDGLSFATTAVMVHSSNEVDVQFDDHMRTLHERHDNMQIQLEQKQNLDNSLHSADNVRRFLNEALSTHQTREVLRKTNMMSQRRQGKHANLQSKYGLALESVLQAKGSTFVERIRTPPVVSSVANHVTNSIGSDELKESRGKSRNKDKAAPRSAEVTQSSGLLEVEERHDITATQNDTFDSIPINPM